MRRLGFLCLVVLGVAPFLLGDTYAEASISGQALPRCGEAAPGGEPARATLSLADGESTRLDFGRSRGVDTLEIQLDVENCTFSPGQGLRTKHRRFRRDGATIPNEQVKTSVTTERDFVIVLVEVNPKDIHPGLYTGNVSVLDDAANTFTVPVEVGVQYDRWQLLALLVGVPSVLIGTVLVSASTTTPLFTNWRSVAKILVALGAAGAAFYGTYWRDNTWGGDAWQAVTLGGAVLTGYMASLTGTNVATAAGERRAKTRRPEAQESAPA